MKIIHRGKEAGDGLRGKGYADERDTREALPIMGLGALLGVRRRALPGDVLDLQVPYDPQIDPVPPAVVSELDEDTASSQ